MSVFGCRLVLLVPLGLVLLLAACARTPVQRPEQGLGDGLGSLAMFRVNSRSDAPDADPGDGVCATAAGVCTLRAAIEESNALPGADTIRLPPGRHILTLGELTITRGLSLEGANQSAMPGQGTSVIDANHASRVVRVERSGLTTPVTIRGVTLRNGRGRASTEWGGGVVISRGSSVSLERHRGSWTLASPSRTGRAASIGSGCLAAATWTSARSA